MIVQPVLEIEQLTKRFPGVIALNRVSFELLPGEIHSLCGENGAGKSTLIKVLSGIHPDGSYEGAVKIGGSPVHFNGIADAEKAGIAVIYQELALVQEMTVAENIFLGAEPTRLGRIDWNQVYSQTVALLDQYNLKLDPTARIIDLGVGEQQLVEIVKALAKNSRILLLDEPTAALTETEVDILLGIIRGLKARGITCIYISHKLDEVFAISDRITVLRDGESVITAECKDLTRTDVIRHMVGREIKDLFPRRVSHPGDVVLSVEGLTVRHPELDRLILEDISFNLHAGEVLGFGGLMGAGRSELLMHLFGALGTRVSGQVNLAGAPLENHSPHAAIERGLVLISEDRKRYGLILEQHVGFNLSIASLDRFTRRTFIDANSEISRNQEIFDALQIKAPGLESLVAGLSGGNQQKVVLGKGLMTRPQVVFLDEPTRGIDVGAKVEVYELVNKLTEDGKGVILVSSELPELMGMSDRMIILSEGKIGGEFTRKNATQELILAAAMKHH